MSCAMKARLHPGVHAQLCDCDRPMCQYCFETDPELIHWDGYTDDGEAVYACNWCSEERASFAEMTAHANAAE